MKSKTVKVKINANEPVDKLRHKFDDKTLFQILLAKLRRKLSAPPLFVMGDTAIINFTGVDTIEYLKSKKAISKFEERLLSAAVNDKHFIILEGTFV